MSEPAALVLVHGCGTDARFWDRLVPHLAGLEVVALSLPGRAETGGEALQSASDAARWLLATLRARGIGRAVVVGHSYGGAIAIEAALRSRDDASGLVAGLGLVCTGARLRVLPVVLAAVSAAVETGIAADLSRFAYRPGTDPGLIERTEAAARTTPVTSTERDWLATDAFDRMGQVGAIEIPTLVVAGSEDALTPPKYARYLADRIAGAHLRIIEEAAHMLPVERPAELADALREHFGHFVAPG